MKIDFSLAICNKTGKYFIGRDLIEDQAQFIDSIRYWRLEREVVPEGLIGKLLGRIQSIESAWWTKGRPFLLPKLGSSLPMLHLDPATVVYSDLKSHDMVLCHDLGPITHPELFSADTVRLYQRAYELIGKTSPRMVFVSEASKSAYSKVYGRASEMAVIYPPIRKEIGVTNPKTVPGLDTPFLLTVGAIGARKNQVGSIKAFGLSGLADAGWKYVICGSREAGSEAVFALAAKTPNVVVLPYVSDAELQWLYGHARGFVLVSLLEGFGIPVAEAIARGLVPIVTQDSVLEEVAGDGALTVHATDLSMIAQAMRDLAEMGGGEIEKRRKLLACSISRFSRPRFANCWRDFIANYGDN